nr:Glycerophosphoryl diester phosphodiesterase precursor [Klebsiella pneumoniae]
MKLTAMVKEAHASHLQVHPYTVRADQLPEYATNVNQLYDVLYNRRASTAYLPISRIKRCSSRTRNAKSRMAATPYPAYELRFC